MTEGCSRERGYKRKFISRSFVAKAPQDDSGGWLRIPNGLESGYDLLVILSEVEGSCRKLKGQETLTAERVCHAWERSFDYKLVSRSFVAAAPQDDSGG